MGAHGAGPERGGVPDQSQRPLFDAPGVAMPQFPFDPNTALAVGFRRVRRPGIAEQRLIDVQMAIDHAGQDQCTGAIHIDASVRFLYVRRDPLNSPIDSQQIRRPPVRQLDVAQQQRGSVHHAAHYIAKIPARACRRLWTPNGERRQEPDVRAFRRSGRGPMRRRLNGFHSPPKIATCRFFSA